MRSRGKQGETATKRKGKQRILQWENPKRQLWESCWGCRYTQDVSPRRPWSYVVIRRTPAHKKNLKYSARLLHKLYLLDSNVPAADIKLFSACSIRTFIFKAAVVKHILEAPRNMWGSSFSGIDRFIFPINKLSYFSAPSIKRVWLIHTASYCTYCFFYTNTVYKLVWITCGFKEDHHIVHHHRNATFGISFQAFDSFICIFSSKKTPWFYVKKETFKDWSLANTYI